LDEISLRVPQLDELVYTVLYQMPYEYIRQMEPKFVKATISEKAARRFSQNCTREEMEYVLAHAGIEFFYVLSPKGVTKPLLIELMHLFAKGQKSKALDHIIQNHIYVHSDSTFMRALSLTDGISHHPNYFINTELIRAGNNLKQWKKRYIPENAITTREVDELDREIAMQVYNTIRVVSNSKALFQLEHVHVSMLLMLYASYTSVLYTDIVREMKSAFSIQSVAKAVDYLLDAKLITKNLSSLKHSYNLTGLGVKKASTILQTINKQS
jgi:hypothetical protein